MIILIYTLLDIYEEIMVLRGDQRFINRMLRTSKSEAEQAVEAANAQDPINLNINFENHGKEDK